VFGRDPATRRANHFVVSEVTVKPFVQKFSLFRFSENYGCLAASRLGKRGRIAIVTDVGSGMRWTLGMLSAQTRADESMPADGKGVWSWPPDAGVKSEDDDLQATEAIKARSPGRARYKP
jgi:hypothetical protein